MEPVRVSNLRRLAVWTAGLTTFVLLVAWTVHFVQANNSRAALRKKLAPFIAGSAATPGQIRQFAGFFSEDYERAKPFLSAEENTIAAQIHLQVASMDYYADSPACLRFTEQEGIRLVQIELIDELPKLLTSQEREFWLQQRALVSHYSFLSQDPSFFPSRSELADWQTARDFTKSHPLPNAGTNFISTAECSTSLARHVRAECKTLSTLLLRTKWL